MRGARQEQKEAEDQPEPLDQGWHSRLPWKVEDEIVVLHEHVLETSDPSDMTVASLLSVLRSSEAAMMWRELRLADGSGVIAKPKTFFVLPNIN
eukprot:4112934-Prymnesium_polylepis.1